MTTKTNEARGTLRDLLGISQGAFVYVSVGRFDFQKSHAELFRDFTRIFSLQPDIYLILLWDGPLGPYMKREINTFVVRGSVQVTRWVQDVRPYLWVYSIGVPLFKWEAESLAAVLLCLTNSYETMKELLNEDLCMFVGDVSNETLVAKLLEQIRCKQFETQEFVHLSNGQSDTKMATRYLAFYKNIVELRLFGTAEKWV